jgi:hypothetical protein
MKLKGKGLFIFIAIVVVLSGIFLGAYFWREQGTNELVDKRCTPATFDRDGLPMLWKCPPGIKP